MRTKALLGAAILAAGLATSMAQNVYSLNVVGYYNLTLNANQWYMIANQLKTTNDIVPVVLPVAPAGSSFQKFVGGSYQAFTFDDADNAWTPDASAVSLKPGEGGFFKSPTATTLTFVGEVPQGSLTNTLPIGSYAITASQVPQAGTPTALGVPGEAGDTLQVFGAGYTAYTFDDADMAWTPQPEPTIAVGQSFFYKKSPTATQSSWVRNFTVPQ
jgi:hypothetical protein